MRCGRSFIAATFAAAAMGCASASGGADGSMGMRAEQEQIRVRVRNHNWSDMTVYLARGGMRTRLGTVTTSSTRVFEVPRVFTGPAATFTLIADPIGGAPVHITHPVQARIGQLVDFTIENHIAISNVAIWTGH
jgi:hypothetical protein